MSDHRRTVMLDMSTRHLSGATIRMLEQTPVANWPIHGSRYSCGFFIFAATDNGGEPPIPDDLWACCEYANKHGCGWMRFDIDHEPYPDLPIESTEDELEWSPKLVEVERSWVKALAEEQLESEYDTDHPYVAMAEVLEGYVEEARRLLKVEN